MFKVLSKLERGPRARLREMLREDPVRPSPYAYKYLGCHLKDSEYLVAALYCSYYTSPKDDVSPKGSLAECLASYILKRQLFDATKESGIEKRFLALLDLHVSEMSPLLRSLVSLLRSEKLAPNFESLAKDLVFWKDHTRRHWARQFYSRLHGSDYNHEDGKDVPDATA